MPTNTNSPPVLLVTGGSRGIGAEIVKGASERDGRIAPFIDTSVETLRRVLDVNVFGTMICAQEAVRRWRARGTKGVMVNISSVAATLGSPHEYIH